MSWKIRTDALMRFFPQSRKLDRTSAVVSERAPMGKW